ncbi:transposable element Tc1 transposase [Trichonephila clavipes]|nr:transposable element Tc1 transposase [Trichonephila clavipes]
MFSEEYRFSVTCDSGHQLLWRERGTCYTQKFVCVHDRYGPGVMVWAGIVHNGETPLHILSEEALHHNGIEERLFWIMFRFLGVLQDLNRIEHAWDALGRRIAQRTIPPRTVQEFKTTLREEWDNFPKEPHDSLVKSMVNRYKLCISGHGQHTSYQGTHVCIILI